MSTGTDEQRISKKSTEKIKSVKGRLKNYLLKVLNDLTAKCGGSPFCLNKLFVQASSKKIYDADTN